MAPSEQSSHPKMLLKSPSKPSLAGLSRAKMSKAQLPKGEDFKKNPDDSQPGRVGGRKGSTSDRNEKNGSCGGTTTTGMGRAKSRVQLNPESLKVDNRYIYIFGTMEDFGISRNNLYLCESYLLLLKDYKYES